MAAQILPPRDYQEKTRERNTQEVSLAISDFSELQLKTVVVKFVSFLENLDMRSEIPEEIPVCQ
jgi:hypothetical protein